MAGILGVTEATNSPQTLVADSGYGPVLLKATLTGGNYAAGQVLGRVAATGKLSAYDAVAVDGTETPVAVLMQDADASVSDQNVLVGFAGVYAEARLIGLDNAGKLELETRGLYVK